MSHVEADMQPLAARYAMTRSQSDRDALCEAALPFVRRIAAFVLRRLPGHFALDDLIGDGSLGLLRAIDRYDPNAGSSFESWAGRIVRGAIFNGLRRMDFIPERVRRDARLLEASRWRIAQGNDGSASEADAAQAAGLSGRKLLAVRLASRRSKAYSIDVPVPNSNDTQPLRDKLRAVDSDPAAWFERLAVCEAVGKAVAALPPRERLIVACFYAGNVSLRQIGDHLGISKQRVSQLHGRALCGLRVALSPYSDS